jgi:hypothetical protein
MPEETGFADAVIAEETPDVSASASPFPEGADGEDEEGGMDPAMAAMMGFGGFTTTKVSRRSQRRESKVGRC